MRIRPKISLFFLSLIVSLPAFAADVILVDVQGDPSRLARNVDLACRFWGLDLQVVSIRDFERGEAIKAQLQKEPTLAVVVNFAAVADSLDVKKFRRWLPEEAQAVPWLFANIQAGGDDKVLQLLSGGEIGTRGTSGDWSAEVHYRISASADFAAQLAGQSLPVVAAGAVAFLQRNGASNRAEVLIALSDSSKQRPLLMRVDADGSSRFFAVATPELSIPGYVQVVRVQPRTLELLPVLMFLKYASREYAWHSVAQVANLTVDDPWLTEPYGHFSYPALLEEMQKVNFHTTIGFVPWNFDRSSPDVVELVRAHPQRFSLSLHGNNHDHREFDKYQNVGANDVSLQQLRANVEQALARMERFSELTKIPYDRVMVFPQGIGPRQSLRVLKQYNFLATVNGVNVPPDAETPADPLFPLRPVTLEFENFPSLARYYPGTSRFEAALDLYLGNPILFYTHHDFFESGSHAFNATSRFVNELQPDIRWGGLAEVAESLYLRKRRTDGDYDILAFANRLRLANPDANQRVYHLKKPESFSFPIANVKVDGDEVAYQTSPDVVQMQVIMPAKSSRLLEIEYGNEIDLASVDISKDDLRIRLLRRFSDFRDLTLSRSAFGRAFTDFYYEHGLFRLGLMWLFVMAGLVFLGVILYRRKRARRRTTNFTGVEV